MRLVAEQIDIEKKPRVPLRFGAKALINSSNRVLLIKEKHADGSSFWTLPGGGIEPAESPKGALRRELMEELRCRVSVGRDLTEFWYAHRSTPYKLSLCSVFECTLQSDPTPNPGENIFEKQWVRSNNLPSQTLLPVRYVIENFTVR